MGTKGFLCLTLDNIMIDNADIEKILDRADIVDVISSFVELKKAGSRYKACCPFHNEKTPSFMVEPGRGTWYCFGACKEGGNVIKFVQKYNHMNFREACLWLADRYGVHIEDEKEKPSADEIRRQKKRESMQIINQFAAEVFLQNLSQPEADAARAKIRQRWGDTFPVEMGIGYALADWSQLSDMAATKGLSLELMEEMGLIRKKKTGGYYDFYRDRIMIPIRDRFRNIIGWTARDMSEVDGTPKYLNSCESDLYHKSSSIFGIDNAIRQAAKEEKFYCVEGAPDVMRLQSIGVNNTIASLGSAWTKGQFEQLKRYATALCFLPDADPKPVNESYGTGIAAVIKSGVLAMECGFSVSVREIPLGEGNQKNDPDSYCTNISRFNQLEEQDFITWYAGYAFNKDGTTEDKSAAVSQIAKLVALVGDEVKEAMYMAKLRDTYNNKNLWSMAINREKKKLNESKAGKSQVINRDLLAKYGFFESNNCYYSTNDGKEFQWSNFIMLPMFHIKDSLMPKRLYRIKNQNRQEEIVEMKQEDLVSLSKFKQKVEGLGNYIWLASEKEMTRLKMYLYEQTETATEITQLGWQRKGFYAFGNGVFDTDWHPVDEYGIVRLGEKGNFYLPASSLIYRDDDKLFQFERRFVHLNYSSISLKEYFTKLVGVFGDNAKVGICFLLATLFRDIITGYTKSFPILNLFGPKGSGKSELGHSLMALFIIENIPPNIQNATIPALADLVAQCANALVHIDEFKNNIDIDKREYLKGLWDGAGRSRMNMDRDKKREITAVDSGVILSGQEMATADIALFSRLVFLTFAKSEFTEEEKRRYNELVEIRKRGLTHLTLQILRHRARMEQQFISNYHTCLSDVLDALGAEKVEDRILRNWLIPLAAFRTLEGVLDIPFSYPDIRQVTVDGILRQNAECKSNNELANFWNVVSYLQQDGEIFIEGDYRIEYLNRFKSSLIKIEQQYQEPKAILMMRKNRIFMLYKKFGKQVGDSILPEGSLIYYLENSKEYMGKKNSVRFKNIQRGVEVQKVETTPTGGIAYKKTSTPDVALCFDYRMIRETYNINLEVEVEGQELEDTDESE